MGAQARQMTGPRCLGCRSGLRSFGVVPDEGGALVRAEQELPGMLLVDVPDEPLVDREATQLLEAARESSCRLDWNPELLVLLLADVTGAIVHGDSHTAMSGGVGPTPVPQTPHPHEDAALRHLRRDRVVVLEQVGGVVRSMSARTQTRGTVFLGEVGNGPHRVADERREGLLDSGELGEGEGGLRLA